MAESDTRTELYRELVRRIRTGAYPAGGRLPGERRLAESLGVSRMTLRHALIRLAEEGLLTASAQRGWYVAATAYGEPPSTLQSFSEMAAARGQVARSAVRSLRTRRARAPEADALGLEPAAQVVELVRLRSVDGVPNHVVHSFLPAEDYPKAASEDFGHGSLYGFLRREYQADLAHARIVVDVGTAGSEEAEVLQVSAGSPLLVVRTTVRDTAGHPLVHSFSRLRPDVSQVEFEVSVSGR